MPAALVTGFAGGQRGPRSPVAAFFDVDGTLAGTDIVRYYLHFRTVGMSAPQRFAFLSLYLFRAFQWLILDAFDREYMNRAFYQSYRGMEVEKVRHQAETDYETLLGAKVFAGARTRVAEHHARGERLILLSGSIDFIIAPLARELGAEDLIAVRLVEQAGRFTGELEGSPLGGERKLEAARAWADANGVELGDCYAYGDSASDLPLLAAVGHPVVVRPNRGLARVARERGYTVEWWTR